jgi:hypothetical protein
MKNLKLILYVLLMVVNYATVAAQVPAVVLNDKSGWHKIGETTVNFRTEMDNMVVIGANKFSAIKIKVTDAPVNLKALDIYFDKGDMQRVDIGQDIKAPGESRLVELDGKGERIIRKVMFRYNTVENNSQKRAHMELWGLKTNPDKKN